MKQLELDRHRSADDVGQTEHVPRTSLLTRMFGTEAGRFVVGITLAPVFVAGLQMWSHHLSKNREGALATQQALQDAAIGVEYDVARLTSDVTIWEITTTPIEIDSSFQPLSRQMERIGGLARRLKTVYHEDAENVLTAVSTCRKDIQKLRACADDVLGKGLRDGRRGPDCANAFRQRNGCTEVVNVAFAPGD